MGHIYFYIFRYVNIYIFSVCVFEYKYILISVCICNYMYVNIFVYKYTYFCICKYNYIYFCIYICNKPYINMHSEISTHVICSWAHAKLGLSCAISSAVELYRHSTHLKNMLVKFDHFPKYIGMKIKNIGNHHLDI